MLHTPFPSPHISTFFQMSVSVLLFWRRRTCGTAATINTRFLDTFLIFKLHISLNTCFWFRRGSVWRLLHSHDLGSCLHPNDASWRDLLLLLCLSVVIYLFPFFFTAVFLANAFVFVCLFLFVMVYIIIHCFRFVSILFYPFFFLISLVVCECVVFALFVGIF